MICSAVLRKWTVTLAASLLTGAALLPAAAYAAEPVRISVSSEPAGPRIEPTVYGQFAEHLGTGIYGGLWVGPESPIPNTRGWRNDVVAALRAIHVPVVRWPGGCFADDYDWRDGIGPRDKRPVRLNKLWGGVTERNEVGTHEFMDLVEQLGAQAYLAGNMGSMSPRDMSQWLEYMTSDSPDSSLAAERRRNGRAQAWKVPYFGVGNETWGCGGNMRPEFAADMHRRYATFLNTPTIRVASGDGEGDERYLKALMTQAQPQLDAVSMHYYTMPNGWEHKGQATGFTSAVWAVTIQTALAIEQRIVAAEEVMASTDPKGRVALYVDEWGTWYDGEPGTNPSFLYQQNSMRDAMVAALSLNVFHRHTARVRMTNIAQMVNVLQAMVLTDGPRMIKTPTYHVFDLYQVFQGATPLKLQPGAIPQYREGNVLLPAIHASAARGADGRVHVALVNIDPTNSQRVNLTVPPAKAAKARILTAAAMDAHNTFNKPDAVAPKDYPVQLEGGRLAVQLPAHSIVVVSLDAR